MNDASTKQKDAGPLQALKRTAAMAHLCQMLAFMLGGVAINFLKRGEVKGTWLEPRFNGQIRTVWITLAGFALSGLTFAMGVGFFILTATIILLAYRIVIGWQALNNGGPVD